MRLESPPSFESCARRKVPVGLRNPGSFEKKVDVVVTNGSQNNNNNNKNTTYYYTVLFHVYID